MREAARRYHIKALSAGEINGQENTTVSNWLAWSSKHKWVSRAIAREEWIQLSSDEQIIVNKLACDLALVTRAHDFLTSTDSEVWLRGARGFTMQHPPVQRVADVSERIEDRSRDRSGRGRAAERRIERRGGVVFRSGGRAGLPEDRQPDPPSSVEVGVVRRSHPMFYWSNRVLMQRLAPLNATVGPPECNGWPP